MEISYGTKNEIVDQVGKMNISGNIIPDAWLQTIKLINGKPFMNAILILSDIVYWYRPAEVRDEFTGNVVSYKTKFSGDMLQRSHRQFEMRFGMSEKQVRFAIQALEEIGVIRREFRKIVVDGKTYNNVQFIEIIPEVLEQLTYPSKEDFKTLEFREDSVFYKNVKRTPGTADGTTPPAADVTTPGAADVTTPPVVDGTTNTKIINTEISNTKRVATGKNNNITSACTHENKLKGENNQSPSNISLARELFPGLTEDSLKTLLKEANDDIECLRRVKSTFASRTEYIRNPIGWLISAIRDDYTDHSSKEYLDQTSDIVANNIPTVSSREYSRPTDYYYTPEGMKEMLLRSSLA